jgi:hypothetical protein
VNPAPPTSRPAPLRFNLDNLLDRAGGGGSFHSGGGHSFGGGSHSFGGGGSFGHGGGAIDLDGGTLIMFAVITVIVIVYYVIKTLIEAAQETQGGYRSRPAPPPQADAVALLRRSDPAFDALAFYRRVQTAFVSLQAAWSAQNLDPVRPFISDAILERFILQFGEQKFLGYRNTMSDVRVQEVRLAQVLSDHLYDTAILRITASAHDRNVTLDGSTRRVDPGSNGSFTEYWSFLRKRGATSVQRGLIEGNCPNCGAAVSINQNINCQHCSASLRGAQYDWVLTEITQESEWRPTRTADVPGLAQMVQRDRNFTPADLEDRASVMFWRLSLADRTASIDPLRKMATNDFLHKYAARFDHVPIDQRRIYLDAGVGSVTTRGLKRIVDDAGGATDYALVEICWSGILYRFLPDGTPQRTTRDDLYHSWYLLERNGNVLTDPATTISSAHCPNCGAPLSNDASNACNYCNTPLTDGSHGWLLSQITPRNEPSLLNFFNLTMRSD